MEPENFRQNSGPGGGKKDSIFSGLNPAPPPPAARPEGESVAALKQKIDSLERNLIAIIERKLDDQSKEQLKAAEARSKTLSPDAEYLLKKLDDVEKKVLEFNQHAVLAAAEIKQGDDLKTGALRELEPLLAALRGQFERTVSRLDDLDKRVTSLFGLAAAGQAEAARARDEAITKLSGTGEGLAAGLAGLRKETAAGLAGLQKETAAGLAGMRKDMAETIERMEKAMARVCGSAEGVRAGTEAAVKAAAARDADLESRLDSLRKDTFESLGRLEKAAALMSGTAEGLQARFETATKADAARDAELESRLDSLRKDTFESLGRLEKAAALMSGTAEGLQARFETATKADAARDAELEAHLEKLGRKMHDFYEISRIEQSARDDAGKITDVSVNKLSVQIEAFGKEVVELKSFVSIEEARAAEAARQGADRTKENLAELGQKLEYFSKLTMRGQARKEDGERETRDELRKKIDQLAEAYKRDSRLIGDRLSVGEKRLGDLAGALDKVLPEKYFTELKAASDGMRDLHRSFQERAASFSGATETFNRLAGEHKMRSELIEKSLEKVVGGNDALLKDAYEKISLLVKQGSEQFLRDLREKNKAQLESLNTKYADALANMRAIDSVYSTLDAVSRRLEANQKKFEGFLTAVDKEQLGALLGVSGLRIRKNLEAVEGMLSEMRHEAAYLDGVKKDMGERIKGAFGKDEGLRMKDKDKG